MHVPALRRAAMRLEDLAKSFEAHGPQHRRKVALLGAISAVCIDASKGEANTVEVLSELLTATAQAAAFMIEAEGASGCGEADCHCHEARAVVEVFTSSLGEFLGLKVAGAVRVAVIGAPQEGTLQ
ncbi:MAG: hypothetical protein AB1592_11370 [Pseudomonadota bacterium]